MTHRCVSKQTISGSDNGLLPGLRQAIICTNAGMLLIRPLGANFNVILSETYIFSLNKCIWKCRLQNGGNFVSASLCYLLTQGRNKMAAILQKALLKFIMLTWNICILIEMSMTFVPVVPNEKNIDIGSNNGLASNRRQAVDWTNHDPVHWRIYASPAAPIADID